MEWLKKYFQNRYFSKIQKQTKPVLNYPVNLAQYDNVLILFSESSPHKGLVPLLKGKIQEHWPSKKITLLNTAKYTETDKNRWGLLNEIASAKYLKMEKQLIFSLIDQTDMIGKQIIYLIPQTLCVGVLDKNQGRPDWGNIFVQITTRSTQQDHLKASERIILTIKQLTT